eukprot:763029_1
MEDQKLSSIEQSKQTNEDIYDSTLSNVVTIDRHHTVSYYINICTIILRTQEEVIVIGAGNNCDIAVSVVTALKTRKLGELTSIRTGMDITSNMLSSDVSHWTQPSAMMTFHVCQGENAAYISGYRQRKIVEIFEKHDLNISGYLSIDQIQSFKLGDVFMASQTQKENANRFVQHLQKQKLSKMNLPAFIKYSSILIHPLLKQRKFNNALWAAFH